MKYLTAQMNTAVIDVGIIEDDALARKMLSDWILQEKDFRCVGDYGDAESALKHLASARPHVVLVDINLPEMNGTECVRRLRHLLPTAQCVMLTVYEDSDHIFQALAAGASGYLLKDTPLSEVLLAVENVFNGGAPMSSNIARKVVQFFQLSQSNTPEDERLSTRESEVLNLLARGFLYKEIAESLGIKLRTVNTYVYRIYEKLHVCSRSQAVAKYANIPGRFANKKN
ncbi:MAG TPA: response regulator transcription factor [Verrucomicrobiae bacterium]